MEKHKQIKRNHHYVWSFYLKSWAEGNNIYYISSKGKVAFDSVKGLAKEIDFYKINTLKKEDIEFIRAWSSKSPKFLQEIHMSHLSDFVNLSNLSDFISKSSIESKELDSIDKATQHNSLEDLHSIFEDLAVNVISNLAKGNLEILGSNQNMIAFCSYLGHQISRTKSFKERVLSALHRDPLTAYEFPNFLQLMERNWWFVSFMFGLNIGVSLYESRLRDNGYTEYLVDSLCA